jgi:hypothetical protein
MPAMKSYFVQSGPLKITIVAPSAYDAAIEAVQWWGEGQSPDAGADHRRNLEEQVEVRPGRHSRQAKRFATFNLLARAEGEIPSQAWERLLQQSVCGPN